MFWLSYECFSILCNAFLLKSAISSHNNSCGKRREDPPMIQVEMVSSDLIRYLAY